MLVCILLHCTHKKMLCCLQSQCIPTHEYQLSLNSSLWEKMFSEVKQSFSLPHHILYSLHQLFITMPNIHFILIHQHPKTAQFPHLFEVLRDVTSFHIYMLECVYFREYGQRNRPYTNTELQRFVTVFIRSLLHSLQSALEKAHSLLPTSNHIACRVPLCQNCSI